MTDIRLLCAPVNSHVFSLFVLGENSFENKRVVHLDSGIYECRLLKIFLVGGYDERFDFKVNNKGCGYFTSNKNGKYKLDLTSDMTLKTFENLDENCYFIEVISRGFNKKARVVRV